MNLNYSVIKITSEILKVLTKQKVIEYTELLNRLQIIHGEDIKYNFISSLNLLYLLNKIKYHTKDDIFELIQ